MTTTTTQNIKTNLHKEEQNKQQQLHLHQKRFSSMKQTFLSSIILLSFLPQNSQCLYLPKVSSPPPPDTAIVGGTVPDLVMKEYKKEQKRQQQQQQQLVDNENGLIHNPRLQYQSVKSGNSGPFFWTDTLSQEASLLLSERYEQAFRDGKNRHATEEQEQTTQQKPTRSQKPFSLLSWNILSQQLYDVNTVQKCAITQNIVSNNLYRFSWEQRLQWILNTLKEANADIICLQEVEYDLFYQDLLPALQNCGYDGVVQGGEFVQEIKRRKGKGVRAHVVATFWKVDVFQPYNVTSTAADGNQNNQQRKKSGNHNNKNKNCVFHAHQARGRTMTSILQHKCDNNNDDNESGMPPPPILAVVNCHLEGHPHQYAARIKQLQHSMEDLAKQKATHSIPLNGLCISGDFNCELQSSACSTYLRIGRVGRKGGLGGVHGTSAMAIPPKLLESEEAAECLHPILEWGKPIPNEDMETVTPHPFRRNSLLSVYPPYLGQKDASLHFTYCANAHRPVAGLDQIWFSSFSLSRLALRKPLVSYEERMNVLWNGLPALYYPSDHLPIGAVLDWNSCDATPECLVDDDEFTDCSSSEPSSLSQRKCTEAGIRELIITEKTTPPIPKSKSPIMAYAELDMLLVTCPFDSQEQRDILESIVQDVPDLPSNPKEKPSEEQLCKLRDMRKKKKDLLLTASEPCRKVMQRILKLHKEVASYENGP